MSALITATVFNQKLLNFPGWGLHCCRTKKKHTELDRCRWQSSLCAMWLIVSMRVCVCWCKMVSCCIDGVTLSDRKWILPACAPIGTTIIPIPGRLGECKPHQTVRVTNWWACCGAASQGEQFDAIVQPCVHQCKSSPAQLLSNFRWRKLEGKSQYV